MHRRVLFQSPLSRGTTPDTLSVISNPDISIVSIPSKSGHYSRLANGERGAVQPLPFQSPLSRGTTPDCCLCLCPCTADQQFQSPLSRGTPPDFGNQVHRKGKGRFQSPLSRGTPPDLAKCVYILNFIKEVSIPSKSGHSSRLLNNQKGHYYV